MTYRIAPGSPLDDALNVLAAEMLGREVVPGELVAAVDAVEAARPAAGQAATMALGLRVWSAGHGTTVPDGRQLSADEFEARWYGGRAAA